MKKKKRRVSKIYRRRRTKDPLENSSRNKLVTFTVYGTYRINKHHTIIPKLSKRKTMWNGKNKIIDKYLTVYLRKHYYCLSRFVYYTTIPSTESISQPHLILNHVNHPTTNLTAGSRRRLFIVENLSIGMK